MPGQNELLYAFNRGIISPLALSRTDLKIQALSAEVQTNWMPRALGSMMLRPGFAWIDSTNNNSKSVHVPFMKAITDTAIIELTNQLMRVRVKEQIIARGSVASAVTNGNFSGSLTGWTNTDESGATSQWVNNPFTGFSGNYMQLAGNGSGSRAIESQQVTVASGDQNKEHALRLVISKGYVTLRVGTALGDDSYVGTVELAPGTYSLAFTPTGNFTIELTANTEYASLVQSINVEAAGAMTIPAPWLLADLPNVRFDQSEDELYLACNGYPQYKIERIGNARSWSIVTYLADDGPFQIINIDNSLQLNPSALSGDTTLISSNPFFKPGHVGALFRIASAGQTINANLGGANQFSNPIEVTGVGSSRFLNMSGVPSSLSATVSLQRSVGDTTDWVTIGTYANGAGITGFNDGFDNQIMFYRLGIETGNYTSGSIAVSLAIPSGGLTGIARVTGYNSNTSVNAEVLQDFGSTSPATTWSEGQWSAFNGYPTAVNFYEGRLWWFGDDTINGSVSDAYQSYDDTVTGNSAPIASNIGSGPVENIAWGLGIQRLLVGGEYREFSIRSSYLDEPLTSVDFNIKSPSTRGSAKVAPAQIDTNCVFAQRGDVDTLNNAYGVRLIQLSYQGNYAIVDYGGTDLTILTPELVAIGIAKIAVQRKIDTRIHCLLADGTVAVCVYDPVESLKAWVLVTTQGTVEDVFVMPGGIEDKVYYVVNRTINGQTVRYLERWALESECIGATINKNIDSHIIIQNGSPTTAISAPTLAGATCVFWADGVDQGTVTLDASGNGLAPVAYTSGIIGLGYMAQFKTAKLAFATQGNGVAMNMVKNVDRVGVVMANAHSQGLKYGPSFDNLDNLPLVENGTTYPVGQIWNAYDHETFPFSGSWDPDSRVCLQAASPRPMTILSCVIGMTTSEMT